MMNQAVIAIRVSAGCHVALLAAGLAFTTAYLPTHMHVVRGGVVWEASFATPEAATTTLAAVLPSANPISERLLPVLDSIAEPANVNIRRRVVPSELSLVSAELPKLPQELEACDCTAEEHELQTAKRLMADAQPLVADTLPNSPPSPRQVTTEAAMVVSEAVLPPSAVRPGMDVDELPRKSSYNRPPDYPADAYRLNQEGRVILEVQVNAQGTVDSLAIVQSSGFPSLDQAALRTVKDWRFEPGRRGGLAVLSVVNVPVTFRIR